LRRQQQVPALQGCNHLSMESPLHATCPRHLVEDLGVGDELWEEFVDATCQAAITTRQPLPSPNVKGLELLMYWALSYRQAAARLSCLLDFLLCLHLYLHSRHRYPTHYFLALLLSRGTAGLCSKIRFG
jgi:hypothetical protein